MRTLLCYAAAPSLDLSTSGLQTNPCDQSVRPVLGHSIRTVTSHVPWLAVRGRGTGRREEGKYFSKSLFGFVKARP